MITRQGNRWVGLVLLAGLSLIGAAKAYAETVTYVYTDPQGTVLAETDEVGNVTAQFDYRAYGRLALGSSPNGPGYTGHVSDADTGLVYMQARYYDPDVGRFLSVDPVASQAGDVINFSRFAYANNSPMLRVDPSGKSAQLFWTAPNQVTYTVPYIVGLSSGVSTMPMTTAQMNEAVAANFSGTVEVNGVVVTVTARAVDVSGTNASGPTNFVLVVPDTANVTQSGRAETNKVGGERITIGASGKDAATPNTVAHELGGHAGGAGDQYKTGIDVNGNALKEEPPGASGIMKSLNGGPANQKSMGEIIRAPTNTNTCAPGVHASNGGC